EDSLEEKNQSLQKKHRSLESTQRKLSERKGELEKRSEQVELLVKQQTQKLHEITGLNRAEAEALLMQRLERELSGTIASRLHKHEEQLRLASEEKARRILATAIHRY